MTGDFEAFKRRWIGWEKMILEEADEIDRLQKEGVTMFKVWIRTERREYFKYHFPLERCIEVIDKATKK